MEGFSRSSDRRMIKRTSLCSRCANEIEIDTPKARGQSYNGQPRPRCKWSYGLHLHKCKWFEEKKNHATT